MKAERGGPDRLPARIASSRVRWFNLPLWILRTAEASVWSYERKHRPLRWRRLRESARPDLRQPIFVVGSPRSGTTFLGRCLGRMSGISYHHEPVLTKAAVRPVFEGTWSRAWAERVYRATYRGLMRLHLDGDLRFAEKTPRNCCIVPFLAAAFPDARFLHLVRDARDVAVSLREQPWHQAARSDSGAREPGGEPYGAHAWFWVEPDRAVEFERTSDLHRAAWSWRRHTELALRSLAELPADRTCRVRYESLVRDPGAEAGRILDFLGADDPCDRSAFASALTATRPDSVGRFRTELDPSEIAEVEKECGALLRELGYPAETPPATARPRRSRGAGPRLLVIAPYPVLPTTAGGKIRTVRLAEELGRLGVKVTVLTPFKPGQRAHLGDVSFELRQVSYPFLWPWLLTGRPFPYSYLVSVHPGFALRLHSWLRTFDLYQFEHASFADLLERIPAGRPVVYDAHNVETDYLEAEVRGGAVRRIAQRRTRRLEAALAARADLVLSCSQEERARLGELYGVPPQRVCVVPNGIREVPRVGAGRAIPFAWPAPLARFPRKALFSGSDVEHNRLAVRHILRELAPRLRGECGFVVHGTCGRRFPRHAAENVVFDPDWRGFGRYAGPGVVALNPVTTGAGTNLKLVHYLAHGLPVLSTEFGVRGYRDLARHIRVRPVSGFAAALRSAGFPQPPTAEQLEPFLWSRLAVRVREEYERLLADRRPRLARTAEVR